MNDIQSLCFLMKITLILSIASGYLRASQQCHTLWMGSEGTVTNLSALCVVQPNPTSSGCHTRGLGSSSAAPEASGTANPNWSSLCCSRSGTQICSWLISRSDWTLDQQVQDSTVPDHQWSVGREGSWIFRSVRSAKTNRNPQASAPHREIWVLTVVVSCSDAPWSWVDPQDSSPALDCCRCCSKYVKTLFSDMVLKLVPALGIWIIRFRCNSKSNPINTFCMVCSLIENAENRPCSRVLLQ